MVYCIISVQNPHFDHGLAYLACHVDGDMAHFFLGVYPKMGYSTCLLERPLSRERRKEEQKGEEVRTKEVCHVIINVACHIVKTMVK